MNPDDLPTNDVSWFILHQLIRHRSIEKSNILLPWMLPCFIIPRSNTLHQRLFDEWPKKTFQERIWDDHLRRQKRTFNDSQTIHVSGSGLSEETRTIPSLRHPQWPGALLIDLNNEKSTVDVRKSSRWTSCSTCSWDQASRWVPGAPHHPQHLVNV